MRNVLLHVQFDGTDFHGWQVQPNVRTVQGDLARAVETMVRHPARLQASSRTDAGVHARAMPVTFQTARHIPPDGFVRGLNTLLPADLAVIDARDVPPDFRPRDAAVAKTYTYRYQIGPARRPLTSRYTWFVRRRRLDLAAMRAAAEHLVGEHDFSAFRAADCDSKSTARRMYRVEVGDEDDANRLQLIVTGNAFLRNMVRIIAGTLAEVGWGNRAPTSIPRLLAARDRRQAGLTAPACGLTLTTVHFEGYPLLGKRGAASVPDLAQMKDG